MATTQQASDPAAAPLAATLARLEALDPYFAVRLLPQLDQSWTVAADLASKSMALDAILDRVQAQYHMSERNIAAAFLINSYAWWLSAAASASYLAEQRVPDLDPHNVAIRLVESTDDEEEMIEIGLLSPRMAVLPDDPDAADPSAILLPDAAALREWLRLRLEQHLAPLIEALYARTRFGKRAQWNLAADACAAVFLWAGQTLGVAQAACAEGLALVKVEGSPLCNELTGYFTLEYQEQRETFRQRGGCCLYYKLPDGRNCNTCSLLAVEERNQRLLNWMATRAVETTS
jgi:hypothetical protein